MSNTRSRSQQPYYVVAGATVSIMQILGDAWYTTAASD